MRHIQTAALELFAQRGFGIVTVDEVASAAGVSAPTIYRQFGSKEQLVLWDEYDPGLLGAIAVRLRTEPPLDAVRHGLIEQLEKIYPQDPDRIRQRLRLARSAPELVAATAANQVVIRDTLARLFVDAHPGLDPLGAQLFAGVIVTVLERTVSHWMESRDISPMVTFDVALSRLQKLLTENETA